MFKNCVFKDSVNVFCYCGSNCQYIDVSGRPSGSSLRGRVTHQDKWVKNSNLYRDLTLITDEE